MKKTSSSSNKHFARLKALSIVALCCTVILWAALWGMSAIPSAQSGQSTNAVLGKLDKIFGLSQKIGGNVPTQSVDFGVLKDTLYNGRSYKLSVGFTPSDATDRDLAFSSSDRSIVEVDDSGTITGISRGTVTVTAHLKSNPDRKTSMSVSCYGDDPATTDLTMCLDGELAVGKTRNLIINNGTASPYAPDKLYSSDNSILNCWHGTVSGVSAGTATVTAYYAAENKEVSLPITVAPNPSFTKPVSVSLKSNYTLTQGKTINASDLIKSVMPENAAKDFKIKSSSAILYVNPTVLRAISPGKTTVTFVSRYDETVTATTEITVAHVAPTSLEIVTSSDKFLPNATYVFWARHTPKPYWYDAKWEVISGKGKITENGVFTTKYFGKTVVRCTSTIDPTLTAEIEIDAKLFSDAYSFTRKLVGHMGLSAVLGFGIFGSTFLLTKRKWLCAVLTPTLSIFYAAVSELIQKFTPGRVCALTDVFIDFLGATTGAAAGFLLVATVCAIWRVVAKKSFADFFLAYKNLNVKSVFGKTEKQ